VLLSTNGPRVAHTLPFMYAPHEQGQHLCHRVLSVACSGFLTVADIKCDIGATRVSHGKVRKCSAGLMSDALGISRLVHERFFHCFRVSINHRRVGAHRAFWTPAPLLKSLAEKVRDFVTGLLRVVNGDLGGFLRFFRDVFARIFRGVVG